MDRLATTFNPERLRIVEVHTGLPPLAVDLGERAVALAAIMSYLNQSAKVGGAKRSRIAFNNRYGERSRTVLRAMDTKRSELRSGFDAGLDTLIASEALKTHGFDEDAIELERITMQAAINRRFGVGKSDAYDRARAVNNAKKMTHKLVF